MNGKNCLVLGAGGFIGGHLVTRLKKLGHWICGADIKYHEFGNCPADEFMIADLSDPVQCDKVFNRTLVFDEVYQLAADMGGAQYIFTGENDSNVMTNSAGININVLKCCVKYRVKKIFYSSSACIYPLYNQLDPDHPVCEENSAYPANPDSEYGWEKLFSERLYFAHMRNFGLTVRVARFHNVFGPYGTWTGGREKAPAAIARKISGIDESGTIEIFGDGKQTRSFLYIDECIDGILKLMASDFTGPVNIGSEEMVSINTLVEYIGNIANKKVNIKHIEGPLGVRGRNSHNKLIKEKLGWCPTKPLIEGLKVTYEWVDKQNRHK